VGATSWLRVSLLTHPGIVVAFFARSIMSIGRTKAMQTIAGAMMLTLVALSAQAGEENTTYTLTDLGTLSSPSTSFLRGPAALSLGGGNSVVNAISDNGEAVGFYCFRTATDQEGVYRGFRWTTRRGMVDLGLPKGWTDPATFVSPFGVNDKGQIAGLREVNGQDTAFFYDDGLMRVIGNPGDQAFAINNRGQVTGLSNATGGFLYFHGKRTSLCATPGALCGTGFAINDAGHIAGGAAASDNGAALWTGASWRDLGVPAGDTDALALGINLFDEVVGHSASSDGTTHAFLWNGAFTILPCLSGDACEAAAINDTGTIVGSSHEFAVVWLQGTVHDLNTLIEPHDPLHSQVRLYSSSAINERGQIAADGCYTSGSKTGQCYAFILNPTHDKDMVANRR
jgi:probable HAF family extracellular repeat protein